MFAPNTFQVELVDAVLVPDVALSVVNLVS
jgi:hypothetical protein